MTVYMCPLASTLVPRYCFPNVQASKAKVLVAHRFAKIIRNWFKPSIAHKYEKGL